MMTVAEAVENASRLLCAAADETNLQIAESLTRIAEAWIALAGIIHDHEMEN